MEAKEGAALRGKGDDPIGGNTQRKISLGEIGPWP